jgi:hypothetical protein
MSPTVAMVLVGVCFALLGILHFALQSWLSAREEAQAKAKNLFEPKPGLDEAPPEKSPRYRMPLSLIIFMIFTVTYYGALLTVMWHYGW